MEEKKKLTDKEKVTFYIKQINLCKRELANARFPTPLLRRISLYQSEIKKLQPTLDNYQEKKED